MYVNYSTVHILVIEERDPEGQSNANSENEEATPRPNRVSNAMSGIRRELPNGSECIPDLVWPRSERIKCCGYSDIQEKKEERKTMVSKSARSMRQLFVKAERQLPE